ncbi:MAG: hypothetical protein U0401_23800 [Anaerolineae bacterium]
MRPSEQYNEAGALLRLFRRSRRGTHAPELDHLDRPRQPVRVPHSSELPEWEPPKEDKGLIQLEID